MPYKDPIKRKEYHKKYVKKHYIANKQAYLDRAKTYNKIHSEKLKELIASKKNVPCMDCGVKYHPFVMDFDHKDPSIKIANVSDMVHNKNSIENILLEINKCDIVCANCHRLRTWNKIVAGTGVEPAIP